MARPCLLALAVVIMAELTCSVSATARHPTSSNHSPSLPFLAKKDACQSNPLLLDWDIPPYDLIKPEHLVPGAQKIVAKLEKDLAALEATVKPDYISLVRPLEKIYDRIQVFAYMMANYMRFDSVNFGDAAGTASDLLDDLETKMWTSVPILNAFKAIQASPSYSKLTDSQRSVVQLYLEQAKQNGVELSAADKQKVKDIKNQLDALGDQYAGNSVSDYSVVQNKVLEKTVSVLPSTLTAMAGNLSSLTGLPNILGKICFPADSDTSAYTILKHACDRSVRQVLYLADKQKASYGALDNGAVIEQMLTLRRNLAKLLGYNSFAEMTLGKKYGMVDGVLENLRKASKVLSTKDINDLKSFIGRDDPRAANDLQKWDVEYWKWMKNGGDPNYVDEDSVTQYFTLEALIHQIFATVNKMFGVVIEPADGQAPVWHKDVRFFALKDQSTGQPLGYLYLDPYYREGKYSGFWTSEIIVHSKTLVHSGQSTRLPVYLISTPFDAPTSDTSTLMEFYGMRGLFHEMGHALQGILTQQDENMVAGFRNLDAGSYELVSMFMIYWCFQRDTMKAMGKHYKTGAPIPDHVLDMYITTTRKSLIAELQSWVQIASVDLELHSKYIPGGSESIYDVYHRIMSESEFLPPLPQDKSICTNMRQMFAGQYGSVFFDYLLSDVIAADAFSELESVGLSNPKAIRDLGLKFRNTFLAFGGGIPPNEVFADFRGRKPVLDVQLMLKLKGMSS